jgi:uncharacterized protein (TIGR00255 family)
MTGFGRSEQILNGRNIAVEIKSVNHRYFEFSARLPRSCNFLEDKIKRLIQSRVSRGKVDVLLTITQVEGGDSVVTVNRALAKSYLDALHLLAAETGLPCNIDAVQLSRFPDVLTVERADVDEDELWADVAAVTSEALDRFLAMREVEGERLCADVLSRLDTIEKLTGRIEEISPRTLEAYRSRLYQKLSEVLENRAVDDARVLTECAIFADRIAVDEETVRLHSHVAQYREILRQSEPIGRRLDFLTQELNRESNTIGSKAQDVEAAAIVVELKSELEKIREQIQNIE